MQSRNVSHLDSKKEKEHHLDDVSVTIPLAEIPFEEDVPASGWLSRLLCKLGIRGRQNDALRRAEAALSKALCELAIEPVDALLDKFAASRDGIPHAEVSERTRQYGQNKLSSAKPSPWYKDLANAFMNPFNILLVALAIVSAATGDFTTMTIMFVMVLVSTILRFVQEFKSKVATQRLADLVKSWVAVKRRHADKIVTETIPAEDVLPGDIVVLSAGSMFVADTIILKSKDLFVSQSSVTGEFLPVEKRAHKTSSDSKEELVDSFNTFDVESLCLAGTYATSGTGEGLVVGTGDNTYLATIAAALKQRKPTNSFQAGIRRVSYLLVGFMLCMVPLVIVIAGSIQHDFYAALLFGISVAVGLTPEMLPMIVNANLARGAVVLASKKMIVKRMDAIQNLGAMNVLCSDKTGTLTKDEVALECSVDVKGEISEAPLKYAYINSNFQTGLTNMLDHAIISSGEHFDLSSYRNVDELPFDFVRRRVSVIVEKDEKPLLVCKGACEEVFSNCTQYQNGDDIVSLDEGNRKSIESVVQGLNSQGMRVLAVATRMLMEGIANPTYTVRDEQSMTLHGFVAFMDPPKDGVAEVIQRLEDKSVSVKVLTGDNLPVAQNVCDKIGLSVARVITGTELAALNRDEFVEAVKECTVFAKLTPMQKLDIVHALKSTGHTVGFLGDGVNDALALRGSDVGISVETATEVAKEAADMVMTEKDLSIVCEGILQGRITHGNTIKYIKMAASSNFGNVFSVLVASAWLPFQPMTPLQLLAQNLLYDLSQIAIPFDQMDEEYLAVPHAWDATNIASFMIWFGPTSSIFDICTFLLGWYYFGIRTPKDNFSFFQTMWFVEGLLTQTMIVHMLRTAKIPFFQSIASVKLCVTTVLIMSIGIAIPYSPLGNVLDHMQHLPGIYYAFLVGILLSYATLTQLWKYPYIKIFKQFL
ncbi:hypothetical protein BZG36_02013 [Bifiguratus adelaidae]|uniref:Magnesium-transporting ATPase, P-type 1 n=1 Tax=Bifiguratus adelaidae TaxID=1938954 RepID=A0A261Y439_9FUNG|nr:hypothetical protein BZG36_02013 [Bifiguratus adelaidae]